MMMNMDGFIPGSRASFVVDLLVVAIGLAFLIQILSFSLLKRFFSYKWHATLQIVTFAILTIAVLALELEVRIYGWQDRAFDSPVSPVVLQSSLAIHLLFAGCTVLIWPVTIFNAVRRFSRPIRPSAHSSSHRWQGRASLILFFFTALTGITFYYLAFVAA